MGQRTGSQTPVATGQMTWKKNEKLVDRNFFTVTFPYFTGILEECIFYGLFSCLHAFKIKTQKD